MNNKALPSHKYGTVPGIGRWTEAEHNRFLKAISITPKLPWTRVAIIVKTRTERQVRTHAQKYFEKIKRHEKKQRNKENSTKQPLTHSLNEDCIEALKLFN